MAKGKKLRKDQVTTVNGVTTIKLDVDPTKVARGHSPHRGGAGVHQDRRTKRNRTRSAQRRAAINDY